MKIIEVKEIKKQFKDKEIIKGIDLEINKGEFVAIMGPSGAGKTTLMNIMSGLEKANAGEIKINNESIVELKEPKLTKFRRVNISYVFQEYNLIDFLTVKENILYPLKITKQKIDTKLFDEVIKTVGLQEHINKLPSQLSGGQKQRVAIARSIVSPNPIIFADEPTGALDIKTRDQIMKLLTDVVKNYNKTLVVVTHDPFVASFADKTIFLLDGKISQTIEKSSSETIARVIDGLEKKYV